MKVRDTLPFVIAVLLAGCSSETTSNQSIVGEWKLIHGESGDHQFTSKELANTKLTFSKEHMTSESDEGPTRYTYRVFDEMSPKGLDLTPTTGGQTEHGIYQISGSELTIVLPNDRTNKRPSNFKVGRDAGETTGEDLMKLKRLK
jgi:uncharacterized protein (TIGR03067 family)